MILNRKTMSTKSIFEYQHSESNSCEPITYFHFNGFRRYSDSLTAQRDSYDKMFNYNYNYANL